MSATLTNPARHSFSHTKWITVGAPILDEFIRISDSGDIQRYISHDGATVRFRPMTEDDTIADPQILHVRGSVVVLVQPEEGFGDEDRWVLSVPAWAIEGWDESDESDD